MNSLLGGNRRERVDDSPPLSGDVHAGFSRDRLGEGDQYVDRLLTSWRDVSSALQRSMVLLVLMMAAFEVVNRQPQSPSSSGAGEILISFVKLNNPYLVVAVLPILASFFQYQVVRNLIRWRRMERAYSDITALLHPDIWRSHYGSYLAPQAPLVSTWKTGDRSYLSGAVSLQQSVERNVSAVITLLGIPTFHLYAYWQIFKHYGLTLTTGVSIAISLTLNFFYFCIIFAVISGEGEVRVGQASDGRPTAGGDDETS